MITKPTVLILGAGASVHFGYPIGTTLIDQICARIKAQKVRGRIRDGFTQQNFDYFFTRLSRGNDTSIDAFLQRKPDVRSLGLRLIVDCLKDCEDSDRLFPPNNSGWYRTLFNAMRTDNPNDIPRNAISFITFNYDRSLECYLQKSIRRHYEIPEAQATEILNRLRIVHPNGIMGKYPAVPYSVDLREPGIEKICAEMQILPDHRDKSGEFCNEQFREGHDLLASAERIFFLGFGFHPENIARFNFFTVDALKDKTVRATHQLNRTPGGSLDAMIKRVEQFGFTRDHFPWQTQCNCFFDHISLE